MYASIHETGRGFFEGVRTPSNATAHSYDPPHQATQETGVPAMGLRPQVDHTPPYRERRFSLG
jgi:hypothetical protein